MVAHRRHRLGRGLARSFCVALELGQLHACPQVDRIQQGRQRRLVVRPGILRQPAPQPFRRHRRRAPVRGWVSDRLVKALATTVAAGAVLLGFQADSRAANLMDLNFWMSGPNYTAVVPLCDEPAPLAKIQSRFSVKEHRFWNSELKIVGFDSLREVKSGLGTAAPEPEAKQEPAVSVRSSVKPDYIVCLEDGKKLKMLKRYLRSTYNMTPDDYRRRWGLPPDYPMVAPSYATRRSEFAKKIGLGRGVRRRD